MAWTATENFNSYADGDLNGKNETGTGWSGAWSGDVDFDVQGTTVFEGSKAVTAVSANGEIVRVLTTAVSTGTMYVAVQHNGTGDASFRLRNASSVIIVRVDFNGTDIVTFNNETSTTLVSSYSTSQFFVFEITLNGDDTFNIRVHDGTSYGSLFSNLAYDFGSTGDGKEAVLNQGSTGTAFWDDITATNPFPDVTFIPKVMIY